MPLAQTITIISTSLLTVIALVVGIELLLLIRSVRQTLNHLNSTLESADNAFKHIAQPVSAMIALVEGVKQSSKVVEIISSFLSKSSKNEPIDFN